MALILTFPLISICVLLASYAWMQTLLSLRIRSRVGQVMLAFSLLDTLSLLIFTWLDLSFGSLGQVLYFMLAGRFVITLAAYWLNLLRIKVILSIWLALHFVTTGVFVPAIPFAILTFSLWNNLPSKHQVNRKAAIWAVTISLVFLLSDWCLLAALPRLGLSFGPVGKSAMLLFPLRALTFLLIALVLKYTGKLQPAIFSTRGLAFGLGIAILLNLGLSAFAFESMVREPFNLQVTELQISSPNFINGRPLRIIQLSDIHVERATRREEAMIIEVKSLQPDLIVLTGDYISSDYQNDPLTMTDTRSILSQLSAPYGVYAIIGNVDAFDIPQRLFSGLEINVLDNAVHTIRFNNYDLCLLGISDAPNDAPQILTALRQQVPADAYTLLLYHRPDLFETAVLKKIDLFLAGHTHGGQLRLPLWGNFLSWIGYLKEYEYGLYTQGETSMFVTRGVGMEGLHLPRMRFRCPPEIVLIELGDGK